MFLYHLKPKHGPNSLTSVGPVEEIGFKQVIKGCQAVSTSSVLEQCLLHLLLSSGLGAGPAGVSSWGVCVPAMNHEVGLHVLFQGSCRGVGISPLQVRGSAWPALELRELSETNPFGRCVCATWHPTTMGSSGAQEKTHHA